MINGVPALHVIGRVRNDSTTENSADVRLDFNLIDGGVKVGNSFAGSGLRILAPGETSSFEDIVFPAPSAHTTTSIVDGSVAASTTSSTQPYHSQNGTPLAVTLTPCANPDPLSASCQNHLAGTVNNIGSVTTGGPVTADDVRVVFTLSSGGLMVGQDVAYVTKTDGTTALAPGEAAALRSIGPANRPGRGTTTGLSAITEPAYPLAINPVPLSFSTISVSFQPKAAGARPATLSIVDNAGNHQVALAGTGLTSQWETFGGILW